MLILIDGPDGSGKSTLASSIASSFRNSQLLRFPLDTETGRLLRARLSAGSTEHIIDQSLFAANHLEGVPRIKSYVDANRIVVCDRSYASTIAYGTADGLDPKWLSDITAFATRGTVQLFVDAPVDVCYSRVMRRGAAEGREADVERMHKVRLAYHNVCREPEWIRLDGTLTPEELLAEAMLRITERLKKRVEPE